MMPMRFGSAMPWATRYLTPQVTSSCILSPHCLFPASMKLLAITSRAAKVRLQHSVTAIGEKLSERVVAPRIAAPRVRRAGYDNRGQVLCRDAFRQRQVSGNLQSVRRFVTNRLHRRQMVAVEFFANAILQSQLLGLAIEQITFARFRIAVGCQSTKRRSSLV